MRVTRYQPPAVVTVEMTESDAEIVCALIGGIRHPSAALIELFAYLDAALPDRDCSFSDLFEVRGESVFARSPDA
jgi:hypothetical protein